MEDRIKKLETVTGRLMRRANKHSCIIIPPVPISNVIHGDGISGTILRYMFPCDGTVIKEIVRFDHKPKSPIFMDVKLFNDETSSSKGFAAIKKVNEAAMDVDVVGGDCLEVTMDSGDEMITEVWISFLFVIKTKDCVAKQYLIDEIEKDCLKFKQTEESE